MYSQSNTTHIAKNTLMLYFRQILIMLVSLYTVRVVLNVLGAEDYGIYNVVAGVVTMFSFLSNAMASASQRYFAYDLGKNDFEHLNTTFSVTMQIYLLISVVILVLAETVGIWFVNNRLVIPAERLTAANWIFQAAVISFLFTMFTAPYQACIIAHENMQIYAYASILEAVLKLLIVFLLKIVPYDKLIAYAFLFTGVSVVNTAVYRVYAHIHYAESKFRLIKDKTIFCEMVGYSGWNMFGAAATVVKKQLLNIILNLFFGPIVNASRAVASQVNTAVSSFAANFSTALKPQIIKNYASDNKSESLNLVFRGCKLTFFLIYIIALPLIIELPTVLGLWLKTPPEQAVVFTRLALVEAVIVSISYPLMTLAQATGKIKLYQGMVGGAQLLNLPVSWIALKLGAPAYSVMIITVVLEILALILRLLVIRGLTEFSILKFILKALVPCAFVAVLSSVLPLLACHFINKSIARLFITIAVSAMSVAVFVFMIGMTQSERKSCLLRLKQRICKDKRSYI